MTEEEKKIRRKISVNNYKQRNKEKIAAYAKKRNELNKDRIKEVKKLYRIKNREKLRQYNQSRKNLYNKQMYYRKMRDDFPGKQMLYAARKRAKNKGLEFSLALEDIVIPEYCPVLGMKLKRHDGSNGGVDSSPSIDRIDSRKGYTKGNIKVISNRANRIKADATAEELKKILQYMLLVKERDRDADQRIFEAYTTEQRNL